MWPGAAMSRHADEYEASTENVTRDTRRRWDFCDSGGSHGRNFIDVTHNIVGWSKVSATRCSVLSTERPLRSPCGPGIGITLELHGHSVR